MCDLPDTGLPIIDDAFDIIEDVFEGIVDIIEDVVSWLIPIPDMPDFDDGFNDPTARTDGVLVNKKSSSGGIPLIYGMRRVGGTLVFVQTSNDNEFLYMVMVLGEGKLNACKKIFLDDIEVTDFNTSDSSGATSPSSFTDQTIYYGKFADIQNPDGSTTNQSHVKMQFFDGDDSQVAASIIDDDLDDWTSNHRLRGVGYLALELRFNPDVFSRVPTINALIQGRKISTFDSSSNETTDQYSTNPAFVLLDYLTNTRFGKGVPIANIDIPTFFTASQVADTNITPTGSNVTDPIDNSTGTQINLLDANIVLDTRNKVLNNIRELLLSCRGLMSYAGGKYKLTIETTGSSVMTLTESDIIGGINVQSEDKNNKYNRVLIDFPDVDLDFRNNTASFPPNDDSGLATADQHATMKTADGGELLEGRFTLQGLTSFHQAQEHAEVILRRSRNGLRVSLKTSGEAMNLIVGDIVSITHATPSFSAKPFRVIGVTLNKDQTVNLNLVEHQDSFYTFATQSAVPTIPDTTLANPNSITAPASLTLSDELVEYADGIVITRLNILVGASTDKFVREYQVEAKKSTETNFKVVGRGIQLNYEMLNVVDGQLYNVRARAVNTLGVASPYTSATRTIVGGVEAPSNVEDFAVEMHGQDHMKLTWTPPSQQSDLDISFYEIRYQNVLSGANWLNSSNLVRCPRRKCDSAIVPARTGSYLIKAVDKNSNTSAEASIVSTNISGIQAYQLVSSFTETPDIVDASSQMDATFPLAVKIDDSGDVILTLDTVTNFDDTSGNFDSPSGDFDLGGTDNTSNPTFFNSNRDAKGFYNFGNSLSLTQIYDGNIEPTITLDAENPYDKFDSGRGALLFDEAKAPFDGTEQIHAFHRVQIATSTTSLAGCTNFVDITQSATFKFKFAKFRLKLTNDDDQTSSNVKNIQIKLNMEERIFAESNLTTSSGSKTITYTNPFYAVPSLGIAAQNMATGDVFTITSKTVSGFTIAFVNSSGSAVDRTFDYLAKGYGLQSSS
jgi:hypothetical protein